MTIRRVLLGAGTAVTTFLVAGAATIERLGAGEAPAIGILGVFIGLVGGVLAGLIVGAFADRLARPGGAVLVAYASFGVAFVAIAGLSYVNVPFADALFTFAVQLAVSAVAAVILALLSYRRRPSGPTATV